MIQKISSAIVKRFELLGIVNNKNRDIYLFGLQQFLMLLINLISMILIGILFRQTIQCLFYMALFIPLRSYAGGYHASSSCRCYVYSMLCIVAAMLVFKMDLLNITLSSFIAVVCGIIIYFLVPVEDNNKPLDDAEITHYRFRSRVVLIIEGLLLITFTTLKWETGVVCVSLAFTTLCLMLLLGIIKNSIAKNNTDT